MVVKKSEALTLPRISVIMSVYNAGKFLKPAIESILNQTYTDFEFIIINDGSKDDSLKIINSYDDDRIRLVNRGNKGLTYSLNEGLRLARGEYVARQDADDISSRTRFEKEVQFLEENPSVGLVGSNNKHIGGEGKPSGVVTNVFTNPDDLKLCLVLCNQITHGSIMMRRSVLELVEGIKGYDPKVGYVEDYELWVRISRVSKVAIIEEPLYQWRTTPGGVSNSNLELQIQQTFAVRDKAFEHFLKNKNQYRIFSFHPSGQEYGRRKSVLYRDLAYLYQKKGRYWSAGMMLVLAILFKPKIKRNYYFLFALFIRRSWLSRWEFEFL